MPRFRTAAFAPRPPLILAIIASLTSACMPSLPFQPAATNGEQVIYIDGAGGPATTAASVWSGLAVGGYAGEFRVFDWSTGLGLLADHVADMSYKRARATDLAAEITAMRNERPDDRLTVIAFSAGTAVAALALESLPPDVQIDGLILIQSSLSADYDLAPALRHVAGRVHVLISDRDEYLTLGVPLAGTADRRFCGLCAAGLYGFSPPANASAATLTLYERLETTPWRPEFAEYGHLGRHYDAASEGFVAAMIAPLFNLDRAIPQSLVP